MSGSDWSGLRDRMRSAQPMASTGSPGLRGHDRSKAGDSGAHLGYSEFASSRAHGGGSTVGGGGGTTVGQQGEAKLETSLLQHR